VPFIGVDVSATGIPSYYHLTQAGIEDGEALMVGEVWITAPVGASDYWFASVPLPPGGPPSVSIPAFGTGVPVGLLGVQFTPDPEVAGDYEIAINMIGGNETTLFVTVEPSDPMLETVIITDIDLTESAESNSVTLTWQSHPGSTYAVFASDDLQTWTQLNNDSVASEGDQTSYTDEAISQKETSRYYRVEESAFAGPQVISSGEVFHLKIKPELDPSLDPPTPPTTRPQWFMMVVHF